MAFTGAGWGKAGWVRTYILRKGSNHGEFSGAQFTKLSLNTMPEPEACLGKDANSNMSTLARTEVRTLANINKGEYLSLTMHSPLSASSPVPSRQLCLLRATWYYPLQYPKVLLSIYQIFSDLPPKRKNPSSSVCHSRAPCLISPRITSQPWLPPYILSHASFTSV